MKFLPKISFLKYTREKNVYNMNENMKYKKATPLFQH